MFLPLLGTEKYQRNRPLVAEFGLLVNMEGTEKWASLFECGTFNKEGPYQKESP